MVLPSMPSAAAENENDIVRICLQGGLELHDIAKYASMDSQELHYVVKTTFEVVTNSMTLPKHAFGDSQEPHEIFKVCLWASQELNDIAQPGTT